MSTGVTVARNGAVSSNSGLAACTSGFNPIPRNARAALEIGSASEGHGGAAAGGRGVSANGRLPPPGRGRMDVASGRMKGSSLSGTGQLLRS